MTYISLPVEATPQGMTKLLGDRYGDGNGERRDEKEAYKDVFRGKEMKI